MTEAREQSTNGALPRLEGDVPGLLTILRCDQSGLPTIAVHGEVDLLGYEILRNSLRRALDDSTSVIVDLSGTQFMDSTGLNVLISASHRATEDGGLLRIRGADARLRKLFEISGARSILEVEEN